MKTSRIMAVAVFLVAAVLLASCKPAITSSPSSTSSKPLATSVTISSTTPKSTSTASGPYGDLRVAVSSFSEDTFDPIKGTTSNTQFLTPMSDLFFGMQGTELTPRIIEKWQLAADGLFWTYNVRKGIKFHNGDNLTAKDVKFSLERYALPESILADIRIALVRVDMVDDYTVRVLTKGPQIYFPTLQTLVAPGMSVVMPKDYIDKNGIENFKQKPIGAGPYKFVNHAPGDSITYEALDQHWRVVPDFKKLTFYKVPEESTRAAMIQAGQADMSELGTESAGRLEASGLKVRPLAYFFPFIIMHGAYDPRVAGQPIADIRVRTALSLAINRADIIKNFYRGKALAPGVTGLTPISQDVDWDYWVKYAQQAYRFDQAEAKRLLAEAGYAKGFTIKLFFSYQVGAEELPGLAQVVAANWENVGVKVEQNLVDYGAWTAARTPQKSTTLLGAASLAKTSLNPNPLYRLDLYFGAANVYRLLGAEPTEFDRTLKATSDTLDAAKRKETLAKGIKLTTDSYTLNQICQSPSLVVQGPQVDLEFPVPSIFIANYMDLAKHPKR